LDQCPIGHPDRTAALTNFAWACLQGYIHKNLHLSLFRDTLTLRPPGHPDHPLYLYHLTEALCNRFEQSDSIVDIDESIQLHRQAISLCPEGHPD
ncbi:hypothetical protein EDB19DRAFT_1587377, partial [Suillus lakei]